MTEHDALVPYTSGELEQLDELARRAQDYACAAHAPASRRAYDADVRAFTSWCAARNVCPLPVSAETLALYLTDQAGHLKASTLRRRLTAINWMHRASGTEAPLGHAAVRAVSAGIRRTHGTAEDRKSPLMTDDLRLILAQMPDTNAAARDRAVLLVGFAGGFRRSELVALDVEDLEFVRDGVRIHVRRSKTDQEGQGSVKPIPRTPRPETCPVAALRAWLRRGEISTGPVFRAVDRHDRLGRDRLSGRAVDELVKRAVQTIGLDARRYGGHSLRAGFATQAAAAGASDRVIMRMTGHRSRATLDRYVREGREWRENAASMLGL